MMAIEATLRIGKAGLTEGVIEEVKKQLKQREEMKIRFTKGALENMNRKDLAKKIAQKVGCSVVNIVGFTVVLSTKYKKKKIG